MTFDAPDSNVCCVRREKSNTPLQALTLLNDAVFVECARALGRRLHAENGSVEERIKIGFRLCVTREPTGERVVDSDALVRRPQGAVQSEAGAGGETAR